MNYIQLKICYHSLIPPVDGYDWHVCNCTQRRAISGVISSPDSWFLPIQFRNSDLSMFVNSTVIKRQANFSYSKKYAQHFLLQAFFIILTFSRFKHRNYVSFTTRVSESIRCKVVALVSARPTAVAGLRTASVSPVFAKRIGQINNFYWSFLTVRLLRKYRVYILAIK